MPVVCPTASTWSCAIRTRPIGRPFRSCVPDSTELFIRAPFQCDYGYNLYAGKGTFINFGFTCLDLGEIRIGCRTLIGPNVQLLTAIHPMEAEERATGIDAVQRS